MSPPGRPARAGMGHNVAWLMLGNVLVKPAWLLFVTAGCARVLGVSAYGSFITTLALATTGMAVVDLGLSQFATREVARLPSESDLYFSNLMTARVLMSSLAVGLVLVVGMSLGWSGTRLAGLTAAAVYAGGLQIVEHSRAYIRAFEVLRYEAFSTVAERLLTIAGGVTGLLVWRSPAATLAGMAAGMVVSVVGTSAWVHSALATFRPSTVSARFVRSALSSAVPIGVAGLLSAVLLGLPAILVEHLAGSAEAGVYGAGYRLIDAGMLLPMIVAAALVPRLSSLCAAADRQAARRVTARSLAGLAGVSGGVSVTLMVAAPLITYLLVGSDPGFGPLPSLLRASAALYPAMSFTFVTTMALIALDAQRFVAGVLAVAVGVSITTLVLRLPSDGSAPLFTVVVMSVVYSGIAGASGWRLWQLLSPTSPAA